MKRISIWILTLITILVISASVLAQSEVESQSGSPQQYKARGMWYMPIGLSADLNRSFGASGDWYGRFELAPLGCTYGKLGVKIPALSAYIESDGTHRFISPVYLLYTPYMSIKEDKSLSNLIYIYSGGAAWGNSENESFFDAGVGFTHRFRKWVTPRLQVGFMFSSWRKPRTYASLNLGWGGIPIPYGVKIVRIELNASMKLEKADGIDYLDAGDKGRVKITIANEGNERASNINLKLTLSEFDEHITIEQPAKIKSVAAGEKKSVNLSIAVSRQLPTGKIELRLTGADKIGHDVQAPVLSVPTRSIMNATGKPKMGPLAKSSLKIIPKSGVVKAGSEVTLSATVDNEGKGNLYGCYGVIVSSYALISGKKFLFGKVRPQESIEERLSVKIPHYENDKMVNFQVIFHENNDNLPDPKESAFQVIGLPKPSFQYSYRIIDDGSEMSVGNGDSILQKGESIDILISFQNVGDGNAKDLEVEMATPGTRGLEIMKGSEKIGELTVGANASARLNVSVKKSYVEESVPLKLSFVDSYWKLRVEEPLPIPIGEAIPSGETEKALVGKFPPILSADVDFSEPSGNKFLDAEEEGFVTIQVKNKGKGAARDVEIQLQAEPQLPDLSYQSKWKIPRIAPNKLEIVSIPISASQNISNQKVNLKLEILEGGMGADADPILLTFETRQLRPPQLKLVDDVGIDDDSEGDSQGNNNGRIEPGELIEVTAILQNLGTGEAQNVSVLVKPSDPNVLYQSEGNRFNLETIQAGKWKKLTFSIFVNKRFSGENIPIEIQVQERRERYNLESTLTLPLNQPSKRLQEIVIYGEEDTGEGEGEPIPSLSIDVDVNIPKTPMKNPDAIAVVIGNQEYTHRSVPSVDFAVRDATIVKEYLINTLGYKEGNILFELNATKACFEAVFGTSSDYQGKLYNHVKKDKSDVFVYYSGHGAPDPKNKQGYLVPVDCDPAVVRLNGYPASVFYNNLSQIPAHSFTVVLDACFSGDSQGGLLLKDISPIFITVDNPLITLPNATIFTSATGEQVSCWYRDKKHSLFTYFFLKGLQGAADANDDKEVTVSELEQFVTDDTESVPYYARRFHNREQTPVVSGDKERVIVRFK